MKRLWIFLAVLGLLAGGAWGWAVRHPVLPAIDAASVGDFAAEDIERGEGLVIFGGCASCHDAPGGTAFAGGLPLPTPFGTLYSTNITPDPETGIGTWSETAFRRAMRQGIDRMGGYLYPAFPYDHFARVTDEDLHAIYAFLMTQPPVPAIAPANDLRFPFNIRQLMAGWNLLFHNPAPFTPDPAKDASWNRGAYLVEGLGHCAACHSPRNRFGARDHARDYSGATVEGWYSPALNAESPAPIPWTEEALTNYLYDGWDAAHGIAAGPMKEVVQHVSALSEEDVGGIVTYLTGLRGPVPDAEDRERDARAFAEKVAWPGTGSVGAPVSQSALRGLAIFEKHCGNCHKSGSETVPLSFATAVAGPDPRNFLHIVINGATPTENAFFLRPMPGFPQLSDQDLIDIATFVRERFTEQAPWSDIGPAVDEIRINK